MELGFCGLIFAGIVLLCVRTGEARDLRFVYPNTKSDPLQSQRVILKPSMLHTSTITFPKTRSDTRQFQRITSKPSMLRTPTFSFPNPRSDSRQSQRITSKPSMLRTSTFAFPNTKSTILHSQRITSKPLLLRKPTLRLEPFRPSESAHQKFKSELSNEVINSSEKQQLKSQSSYEAKPTFNIKLSSRNAITEDTNYYDTASSKPFDSNSTVINQNQENEDDDYEVTLSFDIRLSSAAFKSAVG